MKQKFFELAKKIAESSDHPQHKLGVVITSKNKIISIGFNKHKTNPKSNHVFKSHHAELDAILKSGKSDLSDCVLYIYRETRDGTLGNSFPCKYCQDLLKRVNLKQIYYTTPDGYMEQKIA